MNTRKFLPVVALAFGACLLAPQALSRPGAADIDVRSGGVGVDEFRALEATAADYSLKLLLASKGSGAYLADVDVSLRSLPDHRLLFSHRTDGPLMLADLPPGRYEVTATAPEARPDATNTQTRIVTIPPRGQVSLVMRFDTGAATLSSAQRATPAR